ncbi:XRE family transcriptional regulator [Paramagnetospirillum kuznetsovii]|uniref:XRE family transcriptional regulator n=1 Tax=Paramagnetospirillum kuznetsovii TaxID=2053833 RepID=A0A364NT76_9PROT|nr:helix-turn-helix domain-containing protein [Paramagnetospirillum kuznetsovii]RAU20087.1 XRE family transcriptional regulator [Paramagnetospirillum kuznetsovii]
MGTEKGVPLPETDAARDAKMAEILDKMRVLLTGEKPQAALRDPEPPKPALPPKPCAPVAESERELIPHAVADRLMAGQSPVQVYREYRGMTRESLAQTAGVSLETLAALEAGFDMIVLRKIAEALRIDVRRLL